MVGIAQEAFSSPNQLDRKIDSGVTRDDMLRLSDKGSERIELPGTICKSGKGRTLYLNPETIDAIKRWQEARKSLKPGNYPFGNPDEILASEDWRPILLYWITRLWFLARRHTLHEDPILFAVKDRVSLLAGAASLLIVACAAWKGWWPL